MKPLRAGLLVAAAVVGALDALVLHDGDARVWGFRGVTAVAGVLALRALIRWHDAQPRRLEDSPFRRAWRWPWRRRPPATRHGSDRVLHLAELSAGDAHRGLRPLLRDVADERLRARHALTIDDPAAAQHLAAPTWELLRPDRPVPHDLRSPGLTPQQLDALLTDLEAL